MNHDVQTTYLNTYIKKKAICNVSLANGDKLTGRIVSHDAYTLVMATADGTEDLIYKHALIRIQPKRPKRKTPVPPPEMDKTVQPAQPVSTDAVIPLPPPAEKSNGIAPVNRPQEKTAATNTTSSIKEPKRLFPNRRNQR